MPSCLVVVVIEPIRSKFAKESSVCFEYGLLLQQNREIEFGQSMPCFREFEVNESCLLVVLSLDKLVGVLELLEVLTDHCHVLHEGLGDLAGLEGSDAEVMHYRNVIRSNRVSAQRTFLEVVVCCRKRKVLLVRSVQINHTEIIGSNSGPFLDGLLKQCLCLLLIFFNALKASELIRIHLKDIRRAPVNHRLCIKCTRRSGCVIKV